MYKYELYEFEQLYAVSTLIAKSNDLEKLRAYAKEVYPHNEEEKHDNPEHLYYYSNESGGYHGARELPDAYIRVCVDDFIVIE